MSETEDSRTPNTESTLIPANDGGPSLPRTWRERALAPFGSPLAVAIAWIVGIGGFIFGVVTYEISKPTRRLAYSINPIETVIVQAGAISRLSTSFDGKPIEGDITAVQVALWNEGNQAIRPENVLSPIALHLRSVQVLEATARMTTRDVIGLRVDDSQLRAGLVGVTWSILEPGDGFILQVVYGGKPGVDVVLTGITEGKSVPRRDELPAPRAASWSSARKEIVLPAIMGVVATALSVALLFLNRKRRAAMRSKKPSRQSDRLLFAMIVLNFAAGSYFAVRFFLAGSGPPFGF